MTDTPAETFAKPPETASSPPPQPSEQALPQPSSPVPDQAADLLAVVLAELAGLMEAVPARQLAAVTPCPEYDVAQLRSHMLGWLELFAGGFADPDGQVPPASDGYQAPADPAAAAAAVRDAAATLGAALQAGAASRPLRIGDSALPGDMAVEMILWEYQVHGWDLARAAGQPWNPPEPALRRSLAFAPGMLTPDYQGAGKPFAPRVSVPETAPSLDRLLGLSGRDPHWAP